MTHGLSPNRQRAPAAPSIDDALFSADRFFVTVQQAFEQQQSLETSPGSSYQRPLRVTHQALSSVLASLDLLQLDDRLDAELCSRLVVRLDPSDTGFIRCTAFLAFLSKALSHGMETFRGRQRAPKMDLRHVQMCVWDAVLSKDTSVHRSESPALLEEAAWTKDNAVRASSSSWNRLHCERERLEEKPRCQTPRRSATPRSSTPERATKAKRLQLMEPTPPTNLADRCQLLYYQARTAKRASAALEEEIQARKLAEELKECTFRPRLVSRQASQRATSASPRRGLSAQKRPNSSSPRRLEHSTPTKPRNYDSSVARIRHARQQKEELTVAMEHVPCGENYEKLRRLPVQPFSCFYPRTTRTLPLMYVDVNVGNGKTGRIGVHSGDDLHVLAENFAKVFHLDRRMVFQLEGLIRDACATVIPHSQQAQHEPIWHDGLQGGIDRSPEAAD